MTFLKKKIKCNLFSSTIKDNLVDAHWMTNTYYHGWFNIDNVFYCRHVTISPRCCDYELKFFHKHH